MGTYGGTCGDRPERRRLVDYASVRFSAAAYEASTYSFSTAVYEASACISDVQLSAPAGVVTGWSLVGTAVFVIFMIVAAFAAYTAWLFRYVGFRVSPKTNDVGMQTE